MSSTQEEWTVGRLLTWTADYLKRQGAEQPRLDAELLLAHARQCQRIELYTTFHDVVPDDVRAAFRELVKQRAQGKPVAYLVGHREFYSLNFEVTPDVLIPRPETELVIVTLLEVLKPLADSPTRVVDVGTGSGALAVCAARHLESCHVTAVDISPAALEVARRNVQQHGVAERVELAQGDLLQEFPAEPQWDAIISNPPYVSEKEYAELPREVKDYEPQQALVAGPHGTEIIARLIEQAVQQLKPGGWLIFEVSPMIASAATALLNAAPFERVQLRKDLAGHGRVVYGQRK